MIRAEDRPQDLIGWDLIANRYSFYSSADWLAFSDSDKVASARYLGKYDGETPRALLPVHWSPDENNPQYRTPEPNALILGGRRGYLSAPLLESAADAAALPELVRAAAEAFPQTEGRWWWPFLAEDHAATVAAAMKAGPDSISLIGADCVIDVPEGGIDQYIAELKVKQRRTNARREIQLFRESNLHVERATLRDNADVLGPLLSQVQQRYGHDHGPELMTQLLQRQTEQLQGHSIVFLCRRNDDSAVVAFALGYQLGAELTIRAVGFDYDRIEGSGAYAQLSIYDPIRYCSEQGLVRLHLGMESFEAKIRRGARARSLWSVASYETDRGPIEEKAADLTAAFPRREAEHFMDEVLSARERLIATRDSGLA